jgi:hypothetical protein
MPTPLLAGARSASVIEPGGGVVVFDLPVQLPGIAPPGFAGLEELDDPMRARGPDRIPNVLFADHAPQMVATPAHRRDERGGTQPDDRSFGAGLTGGHQHPSVLDRCLAKEDDRRGGDHDHDEHGEFPYGLHMEEVGRRLRKLKLEAA